MLQLLDLPGQRGLGDVQGGRGLPEVQPLGDGHEGAQPAQVQIRPSAVHAAFSPAACTDAPTSS
ncbi:hypothetical protein ABZX68_23650 [Streptomyces cellulosae]